MKNRSRKQRRNQAKKEVSAILLASVQESKSNITQFDNSLQQSIHSQENDQKPTVGEIPSQKKKSVWNFTNKVLLAVIPSLIVFILTIVVTREDLEKQERIFRSDFIKITAMAYEQNFTPEFERIVNNLLAHSNDPLTTGQCFEWLADSAKYNNKPVEEVIAHLERAIEYAEFTQFITMQARLYIKVGDAYNYKDDMHTAFVYFSKALDIYHFMRNYPKTFEAAERLAEISAISERYTGNWIRLYEILLEVNPYLTDKNTQERCNKQISIYKGLLEFQNISKQKADEILKQLELERNKSNKSR